MAWCNVAGAAGAVRSERGSSVMFEAPGYAHTGVADRSGVAPGFGISGEFDFNKFWSTLWRGKWTILLSTLVALGLAVAFVKLVPHRYTATTQILVDPMD